MRTKNDYPSNRDTRRKHVYKRDGYACQNCGRKGGSHGDTELHAHLNVPKSKGGTHKLSNLTTLCKDCHDAIHHKGKIAPTVAQSSKKTLKMKHVVGFVLAYALLYATARINDALGGGGVTFVVALIIVCMEALVLNRLVQSLSNPKTALKYLLRKLW